MTDISLSKFIEAAQSLEQFRSPLLKTELNAANSNVIYIKAENVQLAGSFKIRGATYCLSLLSSEQRNKGVIAYSTGNHAQAVALAATRLGIESTIVMSPDAPQFKIEMTRKFGATVIMSEPSSAARRQLAEELAKKYDYFLVPPYDHIDVITGQGTIGIEILNQIEPAAVFVPIGGGGLIAGIAMAIKKNNANVKIIGVEPELENDAFLSFKENRKVSLKESSNSIADAIKVQTLGDITFPLIQKYVDEIILVNEQQIVNAILMHASEKHLIVEPAGALALAAALSFNGKLEREKPVVCIASGGNIPLSSLCSFLRS